MDSYETNYNKSLPPVTRYALREQLSIIYAHLGRLKQERSYYLCEKFSYLLPTDVKKWKGL